MAKTGSDAALRRRPRTVFSADQLDAMEAAFVKQQYIVGAERTQLAHKLKLSETQVKVWFQNRRIKWRKQNLLTEQTHLTLLSGLAEAEVTQRPDTQVDWAN